MNAPSHRLWLIGLGALALALGTQCQRASWPFAQREPSPHAEHTVALPAPEHSEHSAQPQADPHAQHNAAGTPPGYTAVSLDPKQLAGLGLTTAVVEQRDFQRTLRTVGVVALDETRSAHVHAKIRGWIEEIPANYVGQKIAAGQPLCFIYSQEVFAAEVEYVSLLARSTAQLSSEALLQAARQRLALWDVPTSELERLERTREPRRTFPLLSPRTGTVVAKVAMQGMYVEPALELYTLSDLSHVWVLADVYEQDIPNVRSGDSAQLTLQGEDQPFAGTVAFLSPTIDEATRTRKVRFELTNKQGRFLPGAFVDVQLDVPLGKGLAVPENAVIRTGARALVFVVHGEHIAPRELKLGPLVGDYYRVEGGLSAQDRVATGAQFLLDSESRLRASSAPGGGHVH